MLLSRAPSKKSDLLPFGEPDHVGARRDDKAEAGRVEHKDGLNRPSSLISGERC